MTSKGFQNDLQMDPEDSNYSRMTSKGLPNDFQMDPQRAPEGPPLGEIRGAEGTSGPGPLQDLQNGAQKGGF